MLVTRQHDGVILTEQGRYFYQQAQKLLSIWHTTQEHLQQMSPDHRKTLCVGFGMASYTFWADTLPDAFLNRFPELQLNIQTMYGDELLKKLTEREIDVAVSNSTFHSNTLTYKMLRRMPVVALLRREDLLAQKEKISLHDLAGKNVAVVRNNQTFLNDLRQCIEKEKIPCTILELKSHNVISILRELMALRNVVHLTADFFSDILTQDQSFVIRSLETQEPKLTKNIRAYFLKENSQDSIIQQYIGFLREQISVHNRPR